MRFAEVPGGKIGGLGVKLCLATFCAIELVLLSYAQATSALAHVHALHGLSLSSSAGEAAAGCAEADAAVADLAPLLFVLNAGRLAPFPRARAWGEVPRLAEAAQDACRSLEAYASLAPWPNASLEQGAAVDVLTGLRQQPRELALAGGELGQALSLLDTVDLTGLSAEPRFERVVPVLSELRAQRSEVSDGLALATAERAETLLGGRGAIALVLEVSDGADVGQAHLLLEEGRVTAVNVGPPPIPAAVVVTVDHLGLSTIVAALGTVPASGSRVSPPDLDPTVLGSPTGAAAAVARAVLMNISQNKLSDNLAIVAALKRSATQHDAKLWFADPALQALVVRHDWAEL